jgi:hypothetical protein
MKKLVMVLGCYGLLVGSASAGERWSAESCRHLKEMKADTYGGNENPSRLAWQLLPILRFERDKCGVDISGEFAALRAGVDHKGGPPATGRRPVLCDTTPKAYGGSYTDCF